MSPVDNSSDPGARLDTAAEPGFPPGDHLSSLTPPHVATLAELLGTLLS
jgi:hypothetical protein